MLRELINAANSIEIRWFRVPEGSPLIGQSLGQANLRTRTGASIVAILRGDQIMANPKSATVFQKGDRVGMIGDEEEIKTAESFINSSGTSNQVVGPEIYD